MIRSTSWLALSLVLALAAVDTRRTLADDDLGQAMCAAHIHTMMSAQATRAGKELHRCLGRRTTGCRPEVRRLSGKLADEYDHITASNPRFARALTRIEGHARKKFPKRCHFSQVASYFAPICRRAGDAEFDTRAGLTECLYVEHAAPWLQETYDALDAVDLIRPCKVGLLNHARLWYRDLLKTNRRDTFPRHTRQALRRCGDSALAVATWEELIAIAEFHVEPLRAFDRP